jgi:uncharacterized protein YprB with RNaseH-like and TPR domain
MRKLFFDIETRNTFQEVGKADPAALDISVVCAYDSETETYSSYTQEELHKLWPLIEQSDVLVTFNGDHFDIPPAQQILSRQPVAKEKSGPTEGG